MYVSLDVYTWMQVRKNCGKPDFTTVATIYHVPSKKQTKKEFEDS